MTNRRVGCLLILVVMVGTIITYEVILPLMNPLRRSKETIAATLLEKTPLGSTMDEVRAVLILEHWRPGELEPTPPYTNGITLQTYHGKFTEYFLFTFYVYVNWMFDKDDRLQQIKVIRACFDFP